MVFGGIVERARYSRSHSVYSIHSNALIRMSCCSNSIAWVAYVWGGHLILIDLVLTERRR